MMKKIKIKKWTHEAATWIRLTFFDRYHLLNTGLPKRTYHYLDDRILYGSFTALVDFVEKEQKGIEQTFSPFKRFLSNFKSIPNEEYGIQVIQSIKFLVSSNSNNYDEVLDLYYWWKYVRPNRVPSSDASGWTEWCKTHNMVSWFSISPNFKYEQEKQDILNRASKIDYEYEKEDTDQLVRLVKIRGELW